MKNKSRNHISKKKSSKTQNLYSSLNDNLNKNEKFDLKNVSKWSTESTMNWLKSISYEDCEKYFVEHNINGRALLMLNEDDLKEIIKNNVGKRKNLYHLIRLLQIRYNRYMNGFKTNIISTSDEDDLSKDSDIEEFENNQDSDELSSTKLIDNDFDNKKEDAKKKNSRFCANASYETLNSNNFLSINRHLINEDMVQNKKSSSLPNFCENCLKKFDSSPYTNYAQNSSNLPIRSSNGEKRKTFASAFYLFITSLWSAFMLTVI